MEAIVEKTPNRNLRGLKVQNLEMDSAEDY